MNYQKAAQKYLELRLQAEEIDRKAKEAKAPIKEAMAKLESWFAAKAEEEGLADIKTDVGTIYWSTHHSAKVASREDLFQFCKEHEAWDLLESRVSKTAVRSFIEAEGSTPPGVDYSSVRVFNFRKAQPKD